MNRDQSKDTHSQVLHKIKNTFALAFLAELSNLHVNSKPEILNQFLYQPSKYSPQVLMPKKKYFSIISTGELIQIH